MKAQVRDWVIIKDEGEFKIGNVRQADTRTRGDGVRYEWYTVMVANERTRGLMDYEILAVLATNPMEGS